MQPGLSCAVPQLEVNKTPKGKPFSGSAGGSQYRRPLPSCNLRARAQACWASQCPHQEDDVYNILSRMSFPSSLCEREPDFMVAPRHEDAAAQPACGTGNRVLQAFYLAASRGWRAGGRGQSWLGRCCSALPGCSCTLRRHGGLPSRRLGSRALGVVGHLPGDRLIEKRNLRITSQCLSFSAACACSVSLLGSKAQIVNVSLGALSQSSNLGSGICNGQHSGENRVRVGLHAHIAFAEGCIIYGQLC